MKPGEVYWVDLATGRRPGIIVSRESLNQGNYVVMVLCTTKRFAVRSKLPNCVPFQAGERNRDAASFTALSILAASPFPSPSCVPVSIPLAASPFPSP